MSSLEGYKPEESILAGGEGVAINPSQAGGAIQIGGNPYDGLTEAEKDKIKMAAAAAYAIAYKQKQSDPNITDDDLNNAAIEAAEAEAKGIQTEKVANANGEILNDENISASENAAAEKAVELIIPQLGTDPVANKKKIEETAIKAILLERRNNRLKVVAVETTKETAIISPLASNIITLKEYPVFTEFYNILAENDNIFSTIYNTRYNQVRNAEDLKRLQQTMYTDIDKYKNQRLKQWNSVYKTSGGKVSPTLPIVNQTSISEKEIFTLFSRFIYCLPYDQERVIIVPPIRGDRRIFINTLYNLQKIGAISYKKVGGKDTYKIKRDTTIIFMPPFYARLETPEEINKNKEINLTLFTIFIDLNKTNPNQIFILSESTAQNLTAGTFLSIIFSNANVLKNVPLTMLEPSYIVYPYKRNGLPSGFIISSSTDAEKVNIPTEGKNELESLYTNKEYGKALGLAVKPVTIPNVNPPLADGSPTTFTIRSGRTTNLLELKESEISKQNPTGPCVGLLDSPKLNLIPTSGTKQYIFNKVKIGKPNPVDAILVIQLNSKGNHVSLCSTIVSEGAIPFSIDDRHNPTEAKDLSIEGKSKIQIFTKGNVYSIRESDDDVKENWKAKKFTKDETEFLNRTRLLPGVLDAVFGANWAERLASFLDTLSASKCMTDTALLTKHECHYNRDFLEQVHAYFVNNTLQMNLIHDEETRRREEELQKYSDELYGNDESGPVTSISAIQVREANDVEKENHKMKFGSISSYNHTGNAQYPANERRALVIGVNKKSSLYKFYIVSTPSDLKEETRSADDEKLKQIVKEDLPRKYKDYVFIY
jgi:hypothetical protein